jgi:hypothetical protein
MIAAITSNYYQYGCMYHFDLLAVGGQIGQHQTCDSSQKRRADDCAQPLVKWVVILTAVQYLLV